MAVDALVVIVQPDEQRDRFIHGPSASCVALQPSGATCVLAGVGPTFLLEAILSRQHVTPTYRIATNADLPSICELADELNAIHHDAWPHVFAPPAGSARDNENWQRGIGREDARTFLAVDGTVLLGFITAFSSDQGNTLLQPLRFVQVGSVCVRGTMRGRGLGTQLMSLVESWAVDKQASEVRLNVWEFNSRAVELYKELGYQVRSHSMAKAVPTNVA